jgi:sodium/bile acid cotransporter 3/5
MLNQLPMDMERSVQVFFQDPADPATSDLVLGVQVTDSDIAEVPQPLLDLVHVDELPDINVTDTENMTSSGNFTVKGIFLGFSELIFHVCNRSRSLCNDSSFDGTGKYVGGEFEWTTLAIKYRMSVMRTRSVLDDVFTVTVSIAVFISQIAIGCKTKLDVVKEVLRRPIAPVIGFCCQFCLMPPVGFRLL